MVLNAKLENTILFYSLGDRKLPKNVKQENITWTGLCFCKMISMARIVFQSLFNGTLVLGHVHWVCVKKRIAWSAYVLEILS